jgi:hypothetical protein
MELGFDLDERIRCLLPISTKPTFFNLNRNKCLSKALGIFKEVAIVDSVATDPLEIEYELEPFFISTTKESFFEKRCCLMNETAHLEPFKQLPASEPSALKNLNLKSLFGLIGGQTKIS